MTLMGLRMNAIVFPRTVWWISRSVASVTIESLGAIASLSQPGYQLAFSPFLVFNK